MKISNFIDHVENFKYSPDFYCPLYFGGGEFTNDLDIKKIIYSNLNDEAFCDKINEKTNLKINSNTEISDLNLEIIEEDFSSGIKDGSHNGPNQVVFIINGTTMRAVWYVGPEDVGEMPISHTKTYIARCKIVLTCE